ncbi:MAG: hypothetical protein ISR80_05115 [Nitrosopumilus sp.]|nr:hypothetical protein [Nitrosopumilus sp.]
MIDFKKISILISNALSEFGDSMESIQEEFRKDTERSKRNAEKRSSIDKANLDKIWGKKEKD